VKSVLDLEQLREAGVIDEALYATLKAHAGRGVGTLALNILTGFGVVAVIFGALALVPDPRTAIGLGLAIGLLGGLLVRRGPEEWRLLGQTCLMIGALMFGGGVVYMLRGTGLRGTFVALAALFAVASVLARSALLAVLAVFLIAASVGAGTMYGHAMYVLVVRAPAITVLLFTVLGVALYQWSKVLRPEFERLAIAAARACVVWVNFGFWVGSLWGDGRRYNVAVWVPEWVFTIGWAVALIVVAVWAWSRGRSWVVNAAATFGAIHFYTQWFEALGAHPGSVLAAGVIALALVFAMRALNRRMGERGPDPAG